MTEQNFGSDPSAQTPPPSAPADPRVEADRARLAQWLTAQAPDEPDLAVTAEELAGWDARSQDEFLIFVPPGYANQIYLVSDRGISAFAPSQETLEDAIAAARTA